MLLIAFLACGFCGAMQFNVSLVSTLFFSNNFYSFHVFVPSSLGISYLSREKRENCSENYYYLFFILQFIAVPSIAGFYLARFFTKKSLPSYFAFVSLSSMMVIWFVMHNFWDLNIWLAGMSLKTFCKLIVADVVLAMAVPGLALLPSKLHFMTEVALISHALLLCYIENRFFNYSSIYYYGLEDDIMYPSYMVILTTFVGLALVRRLSVDNRIGPKAVWILTCLYSSKLAVLFITSKSVVWVSAILLLAVSPPLLLYK